jgi:ABC-type dipeptide/oligopeptide/nickel transport system ATPase component
MTIKPSSLLDAIKIPPSPFPGLRPFEPEESDLFFGRDEQIENLMDKLSVNRFLAIVGTSGSGKSSLVRAGLIHALRSGMMAEAGTKWRIAVMRPSNDPIGYLAQALNAPGVFGSEDIENVAIQIAVAEATLRLGSRGLIETVRQNAMPETENLLVVVDQFEELFRFAREARKAKNERFDNDGAAFVKLLLEAVRPNERGEYDANIYVALTMRSDFLGDCSQFWDLPEAINESQYLIPRLTRDQLREVIEGPIAVGGGQIASRLVNQLLNDITDNQDQLPILQHALMRAWDEWKRQQHEHQSSSEAMDMCCYEKIGGMANALSRHADEAYDELPDDRHRQIAEKIFKALTEQGEDNKPIRRPVVLGELRAITEGRDEEVTTVIETFRQPARSFLMPTAETQLTHEILIDISHESLIRQWVKLRQWVKDEAISRDRYLSVVAAANRYRNNEGSLWGDPELKLALQWREKNKPNQSWAQRYHPGLDDSNAFLDKSRERRRYKGLAIILLLAMIVATVWWIQRRRFESQENQRLITKQKQLLDAGTFVMKGLSKFNDEKFPEAVQDYQRAIEIANDYPVAYFFRGQAYLQTKDKEKASADFKKFLSFPSGDASDDITRAQAETYLQAIESSATTNPIPNADIDAQRSRLIDEMFSDYKTTRVSATSALIIGWKQDPKLIPLLVNKALALRSNYSGVINTLVVLDSIDPKLLLDYQEDVNRLIIAVKKNGPETESRVRNLERKLEIVSNLSSSVEQSMALSVLTNNYLSRDINFDKTVQQLPELKQSFDKFEAVVIAEVATAPESIKDKVRLCQGRLNTVSRRLASAKTSKDVRLYGLITDLLEEDEDGSMKQMMNACVIDLNIENGRTAIKQAWDDIAIVREQLHKQFAKINQKAAKERAMNELRDVIKNGRIKITVRDNYQEVRILGKNGEELYMERREQANQSKAEGQSQKGLSPEQVKKALSPVDPPETIQRTLKKNQ